MIGTRTAVAPRPPLRLRARRPAVLRACYNVSRDDFPPQLRALLTVTPVCRTDTRPTPYRLFTENGDHVALPRHLGRLVFGEPDTDLTVAGTDTDFAFAGTLREYQRDAVRTLVEALQSVRTCVRGCTLHACCGSGKTCMALAVAAAVGVRTAVVVHKRFLVDQWIERAAQFVPAATVGVCHATEKSHEGADICVFMLQTVCRSTLPPEVFEPWGLVIFDEAHHLAARWFHTCMAKFPGNRRLALTATPDRADGLGYCLPWFTGPVAYSVVRTHTALTPVVLALPVDTDAKPIVNRRTGKADFTAMETRLTRCDARNEVLVNRVTALVAAGRRVIVMSSRRKHLVALSERAGVGVLYMGETSKKRKLARDEAAKTARCLFATYSMAEEGLDIPMLDSIVLATPKSSATCLQQCIGRILRTAPDKPTPPIVVDVQDRLSVFIGMARKRQSLYRRLGYGTLSETELARVLGAGTGGASTTRTSPVRSRTLEGQVARACRVGP